MSVHELAKDNLQLTLPEIDESIEIALDLRDKVIGREALFALKLEPQLD